MAALLESEDSDVRLKALECLDALQATGQAPGRGARWRGDPDTGVRQRGARHAQPLEDRRCRRWRRPGDADVRSTASCWPARRRRPTTSILVPGPRALHEEARPHRAAIEDGAARAERASRRMLGAAPDRRPSSRS